MNFKIFSEKMKKKIKLFPIFQNQIKIKKNK